MLPHGSVADFYWLDASHDIEQQKSTGLELYEIFHIKYEKLKFEKYENTKNSKILCIYKKTYNKNYNKTYLKNCTIFKI